MDIRKLLNQSFKTEFVKNGQSHQNNVYKKGKRVRSAFTTDQIMYLENEFLKSPYIDVVSRKEIANSLNIPERAVKVWFQNRRMKEKKDVAHRPITEYRHYDNTEHNGRFINDQLNNVGTLQSNNNLCSHSVLPQTKSIPTLNESTIDNFLKKNGKHVSNIATKHTEKKTADGLILSHHFQNKTITSSTNETKRNADLSIELLKKYRNNLHANTMKKTIKAKTQQARQSDAKKRKLNGQIMVRREKVHSSVSRTAPSSVKNQQTITQIPSGYVPLYPQQHNQQYPSPGNLIWKPIAPGETSTVMPLCDFAILSNTQTVPHPLLKPKSVQKNLCSCNYHMNPQTNTIAFAHENQMTQPQYVIAVPFHKTHVQFRSPI